MRQPIYNYSQTLPFSIIYYTFEAAQKCAVNLFFGGYTK